VRKTSIENVHFGIGHVAAVCLGSSTWNDGATEPGAVDREFKWMIDDDSLSSLSSPPLLAGRFGSQTRDELSHDLRRRS
jgi:hypothetical protein